MFGFHRPKGRWQQWLLMFVLLEGPFISSRQECIFLSTLQFESALLQPVFLTTKGLKGQRNIWGNVQLFISDFHSLKLFGYNAITAFLQQCGRLKTQGANLEQRIIWMLPSYRATSPGNQSSLQSTCWWPMHISWNQKMINKCLHSTKQSLNTKKHSFPLKIQVNASFE